MAVPEQTPYIEHTGNGVTTSFALKFQCESKDHLIVLIDDIEPPIETWSLSGGNVVFTTAPAAGKKITAQRNTPFSRATDYQSYNNSFRPPAVNEDFDWIWLKLQELGVADWILGARIDALKNYVDRKDDELKAYLMEEIRKQGVALDQLDEYYNYLMERLAQIAVDKGWDASFVVYNGGNLKENLDNQHLINEQQEQLNEQQSMKNSLNVDILDFVPKSEWPAIFSKTSNYDCGPALAQAIATGKQAVINSRGLYKIKTAYNGTTDFDLKLSDGVIFDLSECSGAYAITNSGSVTKLTKTWGSLTAGFYKVTFNDVGGLKVGDWLCFYDPADFSYSGFRSSYNDGEWKQIKRITGNTVTFSEPFLKTYIAALDLYKLNSVICNLRGGEILNNSVTLAGSVKFSLSSNAQAHNISANAKQNSVILFDRCVEPKSSNINGTNEGAGTNDYFVVHSNCWNGYHNGGKIYSRRHAFAMGGGAGPCNVPNTRSIVENAILDCDPEALVGASDMHGNVRLSEYRNCTITGGSNIGGGEGNYYRNCKITSDAGGCVGFAREVVGGNYGWIDCEVVFTADPRNSSNRGLFDFGTPGSAISSDTVNDQTIALKGIRVSDTNVALGASTIFAKLINRGTSKKINFDIDDITFNTTSKFYQGLGISAAIDVSAVANSDYIIFDNVKGNLPSGQLVAAPSNTEGQSYINTKMRLPISSGTTSITTTAAQQTLGPVVTLPINYPRTPLALSLVARGANGAAKADFGGQKNPLFSVGIQSATNTFRAQMTAPANFTAGDVVEVCYQMGIREC